MGPDGVATGEREPVSAQGGEADLGEALVEGSVGATGSGLGGHVGEALPPHPSDCSGQEEPVP